MTPSQMLTLIFGLASAAIAVSWAVVEVRRGTKPGRLVLVSGQSGGKAYLGAFAPVVVAVALVAAVFVFKLVPKGSPLVFGLTLLWIAAACVAAIVAIVAIQLRRMALGWITLIGADKLRIEAFDSVSELTLLPGAARLYLVDGAPEAAQFVITEGSHIVTVWGAISTRGMKDIIQETPLKPQGLMVAGSAEPLRVWLAPYIATD